MMQERVTQYLLALVIFLLPWQTRWIFSPGILNNTAWEYGTLSLYAVEVLVIVVFALRGRPLLNVRARKMFRIFVLLFATVCFSTAFSQDFILSLHAWMHFVFAGMLFILLLDERTNLKSITMIFAFGLVAPCALGWIQMFTGHGFGSTLLGLAPHDASTLGTSVIEVGSDRLLRAYGSFPHPNIFGGFLAMGILFVCSMFTETKNVLQKYGAFILVVIMSATLVITFSRSAWVALVVGLVCLGVLIRYNRQKSVIIVVSVAAFATTAMIFHGAVFSRFDTSQRLEAVSIEQRADQYAKWTDVFFQNPITGVGAGAYTFALSRLDPGQSAWEYQPIHNVLLLILSELGILGLVAFGYFVRSTLTKGGMRVGLCLLAPFFVLLFLDHYLWTLFGGFALLLFVMVCIAPQDEVSLR